VEKTHFIGEKLEQCQGHTGAIANAAAAIQCVREAGGRQNMTKRDTFWRELLQNQALPRFPEP
ncbi:MAG: hypothetical protein AAB250_00530, partial [Bdellovibrionota bacterium]